MLSLLVVAGLSLAGFGWWFKQTIELDVEGTYETGIFDEGASEIVAFDPETDRLFVVNADEAGVDVIDASDPSNPVKIDFIDASSLGGGVNSIDVAKGILAVAVEADVKQDNGLAAFYNTSTLAPIDTAPAGALPDMITFTPNGRRVLVANEGEPNDDYSVDPVGSVTVIKLKGNGEVQSVKQAGFEAFNAKEAELRDSGVRIFGPGASVAQDLEPEYIGVDPRGRWAYIVLQENNAAALLDVYRAKILHVQALGFKDHSIAGNGLDSSDRDDAINITERPVYGMYMPDAITTFRIHGKTYIASANEGDAREYDTFEEEERVKDLDLDPTAFPNASDLQEDEMMGRLTVTTERGDTDGDGDFDELYAFGGRSVTIWDTRGNIVWDSGDDLEQITAAAFPGDFNSTNDENDSFDNRSDNKGPEPEGIVSGKIGHRTYIFVGLERIGGVVVYDVTKPWAPEFMQYLNNRDFGGDAEAFTAGDLGPEGLEFISAKDSPTGEPLLVVGNEVSGTTTFYTIDVEREKK